MTSSYSHTYSQLSADSALALVDSHYVDIHPKHCKYYMLGLHDNYLIESSINKYILRIYRNDWRSKQEIDFELELLTHLGARQAPVATPLTTVQGNQSFSIPCPEGERHAALFEYADGYSPGPEMTSEHSRLLGSAVARFHELANSFTTDKQRSILDLPHLIDESIESIKPFLSHVDLDYITAAQRELHNAQPDLPKSSGVYGICSGDVNSHNYHINSNQQITLFDFDQCGYGYRAFEIGKFASSLEHFDSKNGLLEAFLHGYQSVRKLSKEELKAVGYFEPVAVIWVMAIHARNANRIGHKHLEHTYWHKRLEVLKTLMIQRANRNSD